MITVSVKHDLDQLVRKLKVRADQVPFATAVALTRTAQIAQARIEDAFPRVFDRPTPYTQKSLYLKPATKTRLEALIKLKDDAGKGTPAAKYLLAQIIGGKRNYKRFEMSLYLKGILPQGYYAVPGQGAQIDAFGNMNRGQIIKVLSALKAAERVSGFMANRTETSKKRRKNLPEYFVAPVGGHLYPGVYQRFKFAMGNAIKPILVFVKPPEYKKRLPFSEIVNDTIATEFSVEFEKAAKAAMASAR
jgi:hypothetical protein